MMTTFQKTLAAAGVVVLILLGLGISSWLTNPISKADALHQKLFDVADMPREDRNALKLELMRTVDEMPRHEVRELYDQITEENEKREEMIIVAFHAATTADERNVILDRSLERWERGREVYGALRSDGVPYKGRLAKEREARRKIELTESEKAATAEKKRLKSEYQEAFRLRGEELGKFEKRKTKRKK